MAGGRDEGGQPATFPAPGPPSPSPSAGPRRGRPPGRSGVELLDEAREEFLTHGYAGATMEAVARRSRISKKSLYARYPSKQDLYAAVVTDWVRRGRDAMRPHLDALEQDALSGGADVRAALMRFTAALQAAVLSPAVLRMRTLVAAEATRTPQVANAYLNGSWEANVRALGRTLETLMEHGVIASADAGVAAEQLTWLALAAPLNRLTLTGGTATCPSDALESIGRQAVDSFLARFAQPQNQPQELAR